jgi:hypothetical protein
MNKEYSVKIKTYKKYLIYCQACKYGLRSSKYGDYQNVKMVDATELQLRGGGIMSDYGAAVQGTKKVTQSAGKLWDTGTTIAKSGNAFGEIALGGQTLRKSMEEWNKGHYFCCVCSGIACSCF